MPVRYLSGPELARLPTCRWRSRTRTRSPLPSVSLRVRLSLSEPPSLLATSTRRWLFPVVIALALSSPAVASASSVGSVNPAYSDAYATVNASYSNGSAFATIRVTTSGWVVKSNQTVTITWTVTAPNGNVARHSFSRCIRASYCNKQSTYDLPVLGDGEPVQGTYHATGFGSSNLGQQSNVATTSFYNGPLSPVTQAVPVASSRLSLAGAV